MDIWNSCCFAYWNKSDEFQWFLHQKIEENQLWEWIEKKKVQQVEIINNSEVKVYINKKYANDPEFTYNGKNKNNYQYSFEIPKDYSAELYQKLLERAQENKKKAYLMKIISRLIQELKKISEEK